MATRVRLIDASIYTDLGGQQRVNKRWQDKCVSHCQKAKTKKNSPAQTNIMNMNMSSWIMKLLLMVIIIQPWAITRYSLQLQMIN